MKLKTKDYAKTLEIDSRAVLEGELDRVVDDAIQHAIAKPGHGILVSRNGPGTFTVELSDKVPQGTVEELDLATR
jgi:ethanolamine utilization protein EutQ (cupin superfamily)